jgi:hypothetical protein
MPTQWVIKTGMAYRFESARFGGSSVYRMGVLSKFLKCLALMCK